MQQEYDFLVYSIPVSQPARPEHLNSLNYWVSKLVKDGFYKRLEREYFSPFDVVCDGGGGIASLLEEEGDGAFTLNDFSGIYTIFAVFSFLALIVDYFDRSR